MKSEIKYQFNKLAKVKKIAMKNEGWNHKTKLKIISNKINSNKKW